MVSQREIRDAQQREFKFFNTSLLVAAIVIALAFGIASYANGLSFGWSIVLGIVSLVLNVTAVIFCYQFTAGRGAPASMVGTTFFAWVIFSFMSIAVITMFLLYISGQAQ